jgi:hypothetical protein
MNEKGRRSPVFFFAAGVAAVRREAPTDRSSVASPSCVSVVKEEISMRRSLSGIAVVALAIAMLFGAVVGGVAVAATQVHMKNALTDLQSAQSQLNVAQADKAGHRENAIKLVNQAISEVEAGIKAGAQ